MNKAEISHLGLIKSYMLNIETQAMLIESGNAAPNVACSRHMPGWDGLNPVFSWQGVFEPEIGCSRGKLTADWSDRGGIIHRLIADGCLAEVALPDKSCVQLASFGFDSYQVLLCVIAAFYVHLLLTDPRHSQWAQYALDGLPLGVSIKDDELCYSGGNKAFSRFIATDDYIGKTDFDLSWQDRASAIRSSNAKTMVSNAPELGRYFTMYGSDGSMSWIRTNSMTAVTSTGRFIALVTLTEDITSKVETGDSLLYSALQNKRVQQDIVDQSRSVALILSKTGDANIRYITDSIRQYGYDATELADLGTPFSSLVAEDAREAFRTFAEDVARPGGEYTHTVPVLDASGGRHIIQMYLRCVLRDEGLVLEGMTVDISRRAELQERLREESRSIQERISRILGRDPELIDSGMALSRLLDIKRLQQQQDTLTRIFGLSAVVKDIFGETLTEDSNTPALLKLFMENSMSSDFVRGETGSMAEEAGRTGRIVRRVSSCTGLVVAAIPFMQGGRHLATWIVGNVKMESPDESFFTESCFMSGVNPDRARHLLNDMPVMSESTFSAALNEFSRLADITSTQCARAEHLISQAEAARQSTKKVLYSLSQQRLINHCYNLTRGKEGLEDAIDDILACVGEDLGFSRAYLMEKKASGLLAVTHEWRDEGIDPIPWEYRVLLNNTGEEAYTSPELRITDMRTSVDSPRYRATGTRSSVHMPVFSESGLEGVIVLEECKKTRIFFQQDRDYLDVLLRLVSSIVLRMNAEREVKRSHAAIDTVMLNLDMAIFTYDPITFKVLYVNDYCVRNMGIDRNQPGFAWDIFAGITPESDALPEAKRPQEQTHGSRVFLTTRNRVPWLDGRTVQLVSAADITMNKERERLIERLAYYDPLLDIPNRRKFEKDVELALSGALREDSGGGLIFMDLDDFKLVNDSFGHNRGDRLLKAITEFFSTFELTSDRLYRLGGDEFMLILDGFGAEEIADTVEAIWDRFQQPWNIDGLSIFSTVSIGVSRYPEDGLSSKELLRYADVAMYKAKYEGKNSAVFFRKGLEGGINQRMSTENRLRHAIKNNFEGFEVHYQPIVDLSADKISGAEALLRWRDSEGHLLYPDSFLGIAESLGLMSSLGMFVIRRALEDLKPYCNPGFLIVVNISLRQFQSETLPEELSAILVQAGIDPKNLVLGVGESSAAFDMQSGDNTLGKLRQLGVHICLDNKGTSYNALSRVMRPNIDFVNIDIALIGNMQHDQFSDTVVQTSIELAKSAGCGIFCVGVEVQEQYLDLKEYGCDYAQGFFFSHAMPYEDFDAYMIRKKVESGKRRRITRY